MKNDNLSPKRLFSVGCLIQIGIFLILFALLFSLMKVCKKIEEKSGKTLIEMTGEEVRKVKNEFDKGYYTLDSFRLDTISRKLDTLKTK